MNVPLAIATDVCEVGFHGDEIDVRVPPWVRDLASFRRWVDSDDLPEKWRIHWFQGRIEVDVSKEQLFSHNQVKTEYTAVVSPLVKLAKTGYYFGDGVRLTNLAANLSTNPDGVFVSFDSIRSGRVRLVKGRQEGFVELEGTPDMALEIVSPSWPAKDTELLLELYATAGIPEYWLVDVRGDRLQFHIYRLTGKKYVQTRPRAGWLKSAVLGRSLRLLRHNDALGNPQFTLEVKD